MKRTFVAVMLFCMAASAAAQSGGGPSRILRASAVADRVPGRYIVVLKEEAAATEFEIASGRPSVSQLGFELASRNGGRLVHQYRRALKGMVVTMTEGQAEALARDPRVDYVEEDRIVRLQDAQPNATWGLDRIDQRDLPLDRTYTYETDGSGVTVYVIDTGIRRDHQSLGGRVESGFSAISDGRGSEDCNGHGTHVAGTVGSVPYGVAKGVSLVAVRVLNCQGSGTNSGVIAGVDWVTQNRRLPAVANMSLGGGASSALDTAVRNSVGSGVTYAVAAGNSNQDACTGSPSRVPEALTVGASQSNDARASFSNFGPCLDIFAPGASITSSWHTSATATSVLSGTSMASPHVAGAAALYLDANPTASSSEVAQAISNNATANRLTSIGTGSPNRLLHSVFGDVVNQPPVASFTFSCTGFSCSFDGSGSTDDRPPLAAHDWSFGDGATASGAKPSHTFGAAGSYGVTLTVTDVEGLTHSATKTVTVSTGPCDGCPRYTGSLSSTGASQYQPNGTYYYSGRSGVHEGFLRGPAGTDLDLYLYRWNGSSWSLVARSIGITSEEQIRYNGTPAYYIWRVHSYRGSGAYEFWLRRP